MASLKLPRQAFREALSRTNLARDERERITGLIGTGARTVNVSIGVDELPVEFHRELLGEPGLSANQRALLSMRVHGVKGNRDDYDRIYDTQVANPIEFASTFAALGMQSPNCEFFINGRWYPICLGTDCRQDEEKIYCSVSMSGVVSIGDATESLFYRVSAHYFRDREGNATEVTVRDVLKRVGLRPLTISTAEYNIKLLEAERLSCEVGKSLWLTGPVLVNHGYQWWNRIESRNLGAKESPRKVVVDPELESNDDSGRYYPHSSTDTDSRLPFVRVFSLDTKRYVFADVEDLVPYEYDQEAIENLHLPDDMVAILNKVFTAPSEAVFGDLIAGKHGGLVILASGNPGVGKTLTAEVYAELTQRPLYVLELGELGTNASEVEENLNRVFTRVARWDAVLQFDECEIFLAKRGNDLDRSAIVGIFLRLLDYYRGILFLTTNRPEVLDYAILSRVTLKLEYPDLDAQARKAIWRTMLGIAQVDNLSENDLGRLAELELNGRQIRNLVRLSTVIMDNKQSASVEKILELSRHS